MMMLAVVVVIINDHYLYGFIFVSSLKLSLSLSSVGGLEDDNHQYKSAVFCVTLQRELYRAVDGLFSYKPS